MTSVGGIEAFDVALAILLGCVFAFLVWVCSDWLAVRQVDREERRRFDEADVAAREFHRREVDEIESARRRRETGLSSRADETAVTLNRKVAGPVLAVVALCAVVLWALFR